MSGAHGISVSPIQSSPTSAAYGVPFGAHPAADPHLAQGAGTALVLASASMVGGGLLLGPYGVFAGLSFFGAGRSAWRASRAWTSQQTSERNEAGQAAVMSAISATIGVVLTHQAIKSRRAREKVDAS